MSRYADQSIANTDFERPPDKTPLTFGGLDQAIAAVGDIYKKYYPLRHPGAAIWYLTPADSSCLGRCLPKALVDIGDFLHRRRLPRLIVAGVSNTRMCKAKRKHLP